MMRMLSIRVLPCVVKQLRHTGSSPAVAQVTGMVCSTGPEDKLQIENEKRDFKRKGKLVSAVFDQLKTLNAAHYTEPSDPISKSISEATDLEGLLSIVSAKKLTKGHALKLVSVLADWTVEGKVQTVEFEKDARFTVVCAILGSSPTSTNKSQHNNSSTDLMTVLGVANDDEAAKLISNISLSQMIKVLSTLASKKRRSTPLLRSLAFNISSSPEKLDIKQGADALYAVACLNYHDEVLLEKICADLCLCLMENTRRAVVGSIITSLGLLRHKHTDLLNLLSEWVQKNLDVCLTQDLTSLLMTLAVVHHLPINQDTLFPMVLKQVESGVAGPLEQLDLVWALTLLNKQTTDHIASVLSADFIDKIQAISTDGLTVPTKLKLLNINGVAKQRMKDIYKGPFVDVNEEEWKVPLLRSKEKQVLVTTVHETMLNLLPSAIYLGTNIETDMGYLIDAECLMNTKMTPLPLFDKKTKVAINRSSPETQRGIKVAILVWDYHDMTTGQRQPTGVNVLSQELTRLQGYRILTVNYIDFNPRVKLLTRVQYLSQQLKAVVSQS